MATSMENDVAPPNIDLQPFEPEPPTYDNAFPVLATDARLEQANKAFTAVSGAWQPKFQTRHMKCTQVI